MIVVVRHRVASRYTPSRIFTVSCDYEVEEIEAWEKSV